MLVTNGNEVLIIINKQTNKAYTSSSSVGQFKDVPRDTKHLEFQLESKYDLQLINVSNNAEFKKIFLLQFETAQYPRTIKS